ncbi:MAG TPA: AAA family ATPase [Thermoanaerobaculia bacterium]
MRIAISGTHAAGKSTLVEELAGALPEHLTVDEPYYLLEEEGHQFPEMPSIEDFELQLERSIECLNSGEPDVIFDRCPADLLGYLLTHRDAGLFNLGRWLPRARAAIRTLDLIVFVPIEERDRIALPWAMDADFRARVDETLREILLDNSLGFDVDVLPVQGSPRDRVRRVLTHLSLPSPTPTPTPGSPPPGG